MQTDAEVAAKAMREGLEAIADMACQPLAAAAASAILRVAQHLKQENSRG